MSDRRINKTQIRARLEAEGRWGEYVRIREGLRAENVIGAEAWLAALERTDSRGVRFDQPQQIPAGVRITPAPAPARPARAPAPSPPAGIASPGQNETIAAVAGIDAPKAEDFKNKGKGQYREAIEWVAQNLHLEDVKISDAPNGLAASLLIDARALPDVRKVFWQAIFPRLLPTEKEMTHRRRSEGENSTLDDAERVYLESTQRIEDQQSAKVFTNPEDSSEKPDEPY